MENVFHVFPLHSASCWQSLAFLVLQMHYLNLCPFFHAFLSVSFCVQISVFFHLIRALDNGLRSTINQYVHSLIYYMCNDTISRWGHFLRIQVDMNLGCTLSTQYNQHVKPSASGPHVRGLFAYAKKATACFKLFLKKWNLLYLYIL